VDEGERECTSKREMTHVSCTNVCTSPTSSTQCCTTGVYHGPVSTVGSSELRARCVRLRRCKTYGRQQLVHFNTYKAIIIRQRVYKEAGRLTR
jgi:hypothetical protein